LQLDMGSIFGGLLGQSEGQVTHAMEIAERMAPCVLLVDEVERAFGSGNGDLDGGTTDRVIGKFLSWMAVKTAPVFLVFTSNSARKLPAQMIRSGRLDEKFFVDFPTTEESHGVFQYYLDKAPHEVAAEDVAKLSVMAKSWSPAEIEAAVGGARFVAFADERRLMTFKDIEDEMSKTVPVSKSMSKQVDEMREWAEANARRTYYTPSMSKKAYSGSATPGSRRKIEV
jgi:SpoVK/Ycf46/Vps4 family AAA+-type ATPase